MNINWKPNYIPGDLVYNHKREVIRITSSYLKGTRLFYYKTDKIGESTGCILEEALKPIPLTPEILEKNGWKKDKEDYINDSYHLHLCGKHDRYSVYRVVNDNVVWLTGVRSISDLQHLLFGLGLKSEMEV